LKTLCVLSLFKKKQGLHPNGGHSNFRKFRESEDEKFDLHLYRQLIGSLM
jgi:hypothetical protein